MNPREQLMYEALVQIAHGPDCTRFCALIARKKIEEMQKMQVDKIVRRNEQVAEVFEKWRENVRDKR